MRLCDCSNSNTLLHLYLLHLYRVLTYTALMTSLSLPTVRALEELVVDAVYMGVLKARLNQKDGLVRVKVRRTASFFVCVSCSFAPRRARAHTTTLTSPHRHPPDTRSAPRTMWVAMCRPASGKSYARPCRLFRGRYVLRGEGSVPSSHPPNTLSTPRVGEWAYGCVQQERGGGGGAAGCRRRLASRRAGCCGEGAKTNCSRRADLYTVLQLSH